MTLQAVDAANLSENDLQVGFQFFRDANQRRKCPPILKITRASEFEKVVGKGTQKKGDFDDVPFSE